MRSELFQGCAVENETSSRGFQWLTGGSEVMAEMCPPLTCLQTRDAVGVKHPLPLSRTQRNLVRQQVNLTQRPTQRRDKIVKQRQPDVSDRASSCIGICRVQTIGRGKRSIGNYATRCQLYVSIVQM